MSAAASSDAPSTPSDDRAWSRSLNGSRALFALLGLGGGFWGVHIPSIKAQHGIDEAQLSMVLLVVAIGSVAALLVAGRVVARLGVQRASWLAVAATGLALASILAWDAVPMLLLAGALFGAGMGLMDVAINTEGSALERDTGRTVLSGLHAMFSFGAMGGAAIGGALLGAGVASSVQLPLIGVALAVLGSVAAQALRPVPAAVESEIDTAAVAFAWPRGRLLGIGLLIFAGMTAEGAMYDWSVLYLKQELQMTQAHAAWGYAVFAGAMAFTRLAGDRMRARWPTLALLQWGATGAALAMAVVLLMQTPAVALIGFAALGTSLALVVPLLYKVASEVPGVTPSAAIAAASSIGYAGFMIGPPMIGALAHATSLRAALWVVVLAAGVLAWGATWLSRRRATNSGRGAR